ncbi:hypothetical protein J2Y63_003617 [Shinella sp. BE166]|uniref:hypothetical protein n=1 Tax=Shinella sp. BE166 TaxID=3373918 RepID=UPI003EC1144A
MGTSGYDVCMQCQEILLTKIYHKARCHYGMALMPQGLRCDFNRRFAKQRDASAFDVEWAMTFLEEALEFAKIGFFIIHKNA